MSNLSLSERFNQLTARERGIIFWASLLGLLLLGSMPLESLWKQAQENRAQLVELNRNNQISLQQIALYEERLAQDPNRDHLQRRQLLQQEHAKLDKTLETELLDMVPARRMPAVLARMLDGAAGLKLVSFESIAPVALLEVGEEKKLNLYSHGIALTLEGDYFALVKFVQLIENMEHKLYWKRLDYQVQAYPKAEVQLILHTLSINEDFIRVANH
ncbi:MSHA biogenesis protein MshJ [Shewanella sp. JM162201]|uniref:MSHA biogenesis protein MshJ n=1 Tax=Shewanella jiangmenensis TaxID=2837387 RepID=A0ABS5V0V1_9GAMM|nr:MSHA biogenesis protein MshJ [Shewanella jiangmenensis]MBT1444100.1 MSHA biogenesis protein MshJ [Shewanella jiangmenensis]